MDAIYPLSCCDDTYTNMRFSLLIGLDFDRPLCPQTLEASLYKVLTADENWMKLTGRLRRNKDKQLEIHVPRQFSTTKPAMRFTAHTYLYPLAQHPLAEHLPRSSDKISVFTGNEKCRPFYASAGSLQSLRTYLNNDISVLMVHVTRFSDATFIGVILPHVVADAVSIGLLFKAWADVLNGKPAPPLVSYKEDRLAQVISETGLQNGAGIVASFAVDWWQELVYIFWILVGILLHFKVLSCTIYIPAKAIRKWREESLAELPGNWVSEGDVLTAWLINHCLPNLRSNVTAWIVADIRQRLPRMPANYFGNAALPLICPVLDRQNLSIARVARNIRSSITHQGTAEQLAKELKYITEYRQTTGRDGVLAVKGAEPLVISNWTRAGLMEVDFRGALAGFKKEWTGAEEKGVFPNSATQLSHAFLLPTRFFVWIVGKDQDGGYIVQCQVPKAHFERFKWAVQSSF